eukprot:564952-Rhodomonas_salina.2
MMGQTTKRRETGRAHTDVAVAVWDLRLGRCAGGIREPGGTQSALGRSHRIVAPAQDKRVGEMTFHMRNVQWRSLTRSAHKRKVRPC